VKSAPSEVRGLYKMRTIARLTGFSPALLRAWERRHSLLEPARGTGGHRLYTASDLAVLQSVRTMIDAGRSIGEIAVLGRGALLSRAGDVAAHHGAQLTSSGVAQEAGGAAAVDFSSAAVRIAPAIADPLARLAAEVADGAAALDGAAIGRALDEAFAAHSAEVAVQHVIEPAAAEIGRRWLDGTCSVAGEHLASAIFVRRLLKLFDAGRITSPAAPLAIAACLPNERHEVGALVIAFHLHRAGVRVTYLGADLPVEDIERAVDLLRPRAALLSVSRIENMTPSLSPLCRVIERRGRETRFVVGGAGVSQEAAAAIEGAGGVVWRRDRSLSELATVFGAPTPRGATTEHGVAEVAAEAPRRGARKKGGARDR